MLLLSACSSSSQSETSGASTAAVIDQFRSAGLPVTGTFDFTADNDPNDLLGRPNGYVAKVAWTDARTSSETPAGPDDWDVELGGSVEQFRSVQDAIARAKYIAGILKAAPMLGSEYDYVAGTFVIRVSAELTPDEAKEYHEAVK